MNGREFAKLARVHLLPHLRGFKLKNGYLWLPPVNRLWRRFDLQSSGFSRTDFTIHYAVSPLYVPGTVRVYPQGLAKPLSWWIWEPGDAAGEALMMGEVLAEMLAEGVPFLESVATPADVIARLRPEGDKDLHVLESRAYSLILDRRYDDALHELERLRRVAVGREEAWVVKLGRRGEKVRRAIERDPATAIAMLDRWNEENRAELPTGIA